MMTGKEILDIIFKHYRNGKEERLLYIDNSCLINDYYVLDREDVICIEKSDSIWKDISSDTIRILKRAWELKTFCDSDVLSSWKGKPEPVEDGFSSISIYSKRKKLRFSIQSKEKGMEIIYYLRISDFYDECQEILKPVKEKYISMLKSKIEVLEKNLDDVLIKLGRAYAALEKIEDL